MIIFETRLFSLGEEVKETSRTKSTKIVIQLEKEQPLKQRWWQRHGQINLKKSSGFQRYSCHKHL